MKLNKSTLHQQRRQLDEKLKGWQLISRVPRPRSGWLKAVRESLGMSTRQLASLLGTGNSSILRIEARELQGKVTLETLDRAAQAMGCKVVYAIVPAESLEHIVDQKSQEAARALLRSVSHSMKLEKQEVTGQAAQTQLNELAQELKRKLDPSIWKWKA